MVDQEERRAGGNLGGAVRGVVDRHDQGVRAEPVVGHDLPDRAERGGRHDDVGAADRRARADRHGHGRDPGGLTGLDGQRLGALEVTIEQHEVHAGEEVPEHRQVAPALDPGPDERGARPAVQHRREPADGHA